MSQGITVPAAMSVSIVGLDLGLTGSLAVMISPVVIEVCHVSSPYRKDYSVVKDSSLVISSPFQHAIRRATYYPGNRN